MSWLGVMYRNETNVAFSKLWVRALVISLAIVLIGLVSLVTRGLDLSLEFKGGAAWQLPSNGVTVDDARAVLRDLGLPEARIQTGDGDLRVRAELDAEGSKASEVSAALIELTGISQEQLSFSSAGASWGREITEKAVQALVVFLVVITLYITIRLRWQMAVGALVAVIHDVATTVGLYSLFQWDVSPATVISFLTIMGFSLYDTLVVFDKVRDNEYRYSQTKMTPTEVMDLSLNQVLMRSVNTSITALLPIIAVLVVGSWIMGAVTLQEFAVALLIGLFFGAFSSIFIAAPITVWISNRGAVDTSTEGRQYRLTEEVRGRARSRSAVAPVAATPTGVIPPRPRKQKRR